MNAGARWCRSVLRHGEPDALGHGDGTGGQQAVLRHRGDLPTRTEGQEGAGARNGGEIIPASAVRSTRHAALARMGFAFRFSRLGPVLRSRRRWQELAGRTISAPDATVRVPGSKSLTNRALVCAALAEGPSRLVGLARERRHRGDDRRPGAARRDGSSARARTLFVHGTGGDFAIPLHPIDCRASGTTMRFLTACAALVRGRVVLDGVAAHARAADPGPGRRAERARRERAHRRGLSAGHVQGGRLTGGRVAVDASEVEPVPVGAAHGRAARGGRGRDHRRCRSRRARTST